MTIIMVIKSTLLVISSLLFSTSISFATELNIEQLSTARKDSDTDIKMQLIKSSAEPQSVLLFIQDSKCKSSAKQFFELTHSVASNFTRLYVEKIGETDAQEKHHQCSEKFLSNSSIDQRISDYQQVLTYLRTSASWWDKDLYIIGEAQGGLIAGLIASTTPETNKLAIISFGGGMTMAEAWIAALTKTMQKNGRTTAQIDEMQLRSKQFFKDSIAESTSKAELANNVTYKWWASVVDVRLSDTLVELDIPIFIAHGTEDAKIPVESAQQVYDLFSTLEMDNLFYTEYPGTIKKINLCHSNSENQTTPAYTDALNWLAN